MVDLSEGLIEDKVYSASFFNDLVDEFKKCECETKEFANNVKAHRYIGGKISYYVFNDGKILKEQVINNDGSVCLRRETSLVAKSCK